MQKYSGHTVRSEQMMDMYSSDLLEHSQRGTGIILMWERKFVFAVSEESFWDKTVTPWTISYTNIGGKVEPGESFHEAAKREALEEAHCAVELLPAPHTLVCTLEKKTFTQYILEDDVPPLLIYNTQQLRLSVCVYSARSFTVPEPCQEVPALLFMLPSRIQGGLCNELVQSGCIIKEQVGGQIPRDALLRPWGSADLLAAHFKTLDSIVHFDTGSAEKRNSR